MVVAAFGALSQPTRLAVFRLLVRHAPEGLPAGRIAESLGVAPNALSFHLNALVQAGLVSSHPEGRFIWYRPDIEAMNGLVAYLTENCCVASPVCDPDCLPCKPAQVAPAKMTRIKRRAKN